MVVAPLKKGDVETVPMTAVFEFRKHWLMAYFHVEKNSDSAIETRP